MQEEFSVLRKQFWGQHMWATGYFCRTVGTVTEEIKDEDPFVYKSIDEILENIVPTIEVIEIIKPVYNFKAS